MARKKVVVDPDALERFASEVEHRRLQAGLTQKELAALVGFSYQTVGAVERCERTPTLHFAKQADKVLEARGALLDLFPKRGTTQRRWNLHKYVDLERRARALGQFQPQVLPALLQTEAYARAELSSAVPPKPQQDLEALLSARLTRQQVFERSPLPLMAQFIIDEGALRRSVGGSQVMRAQWAHVLNQAQHPFITVQVLTFDNGVHPVLHGACTILDMSSTESLLYVETMAGGQTLSDPDLLASAAHRFGTLRAIALSPSESLTFLRDLMKGHKG